MGTLYVRNQNGELTPTTEVLVRGEASTSDVPKGVVAEAERVASLILDVRGSNSLTFIAITDMHEMGDNDHTDATIIARTRRANKNAGQAAKLISDKVGLDFFANLGDYAFGVSNANQTTTPHDLMQSIMAAKSYTAAVAAANESIELPGNHDPLLMIKDDSGNCITNDIITGLIGNYKYLDITAKKVRVIGLNTAEYTNGHESTARISGEQLRWFAEALDLSGKADAANWSIIILSHHPLDWAGLETVVGVLKSYTAAGSYSATHNGVAVSYNYAGKNMATIIANFHGHVHNLKVDKITGTEILRLAIPNACFYRNNEYGENGKTDSNGVEFGEVDEETGKAIIWPKYDDAGKNTAFCAVSIDLTEKLICAICFGAGYDRVVSYGVGEDNDTYTITNKLTNATNSNAASVVKKGASYSCTITANEGYELESLEVLMGGRDTLAVQIDGGNIRINEVTGDVVITAKAVASQSYDVDNLVPTATVVNGTDIYNGKGYKDGYRISGAIGESALSGYVKTGQMPYPLNSDGTHKTIYIRGATLDMSDNNCRWTGCPASVAATAENCVQLSCASTAGASYMLSTYFTIETLGTNYYKLTPNEAGFSSHPTTVGSMLMSLRGSGADLIITTDQPIE